MSLSQHTVIIRSAKAQDRECLAQLINDNSLLANTSLHPYISEEQRLDLIDFNHKEPVYLIAEMNSKLCGYVCLYTSSKFREKHVAYLAIAVHSDYQNQGIGKQLMQEALHLSDNWLNIIRIELDVSTQNDRAVSLYKKLGFEIEGEKKYASFGHGTYNNLYFMARISPSFLESQQ